MKNRIDFKKELSDLIGDNFSFDQKEDKKGVVCMWCRLHKASFIKELAKLMKKIDGRLITVTASKLKDDLKEIIYHFDLDGDVCNVVININDNKVDSITPILKTADWTERELQELYSIEVINHPNPKRLFLEETIDEGIMNQYIPLSEAMNGSSSQTLWEKVISANKEQDNG